MKATAKVVESGQPETKAQTCYDIWFWNGHRFDCQEDRDTLEDARDVGTGYGVPYHIVKIDLPAI